jgi:hypothetical protein
VSDDTQFKPPTTTAEVLDQLFYSDPEAMAPHVDAMIDRAVDKRIAQRDAMAPYHAEVLRSKQAMNKFLEKNSSIAKDEKAMAAIYRQFIREQRRDLERLARNKKWGENYTEAQARTLGEKDLTEWHRNRRAEGHRDIRTAEQLINDAALAYENWSGTKLYREGSEEQKRSRRIADRKAEADKVKGITRQSWETPEEDATPSTMRDERSGDDLSMEQYTARQMGMEGQANVDPDAARYSRGFDAIKQGRPQREHGKLARIGGVALTNK